MIGDHKIRHDFLSMYKCSTTMHTARHPRSTASFLGRGQRLPIDSRACANVREVVTIAVRSQSKLACALPRAHGRCKIDQCRDVARLKGASIDGSKPTNLAILGMRCGPPALICTTTLPFLSRQLRQSICTFHMPVFRYKHCVEVLAETDLDATA